MAESARSYERWEDVKSTLRQAMGEAIYTSWIAPLDFEAFDNGVVKLSAPTKFFCDSVESAHGAQIKAAWRGIDATVKRILYAVRPGAAAEPRPHLTVIDGDRAAPRRESPLGSVPAEAASAETEALQSISLNERQRFDSFVVGRPNKFAYTAALQIAEEPRSQHNPLFLHGHSGLGKTHLLHSIAWRRRELFPNERVLFISAETFLVSFIAALRRNATIAFKQMLRNVDMLIVDDVQHIIGKNSTQIEFFHTFNYLADQNSRIVLSADRSPTDLDGLDERLRSRLGWGLVADLHPTDYELRRGILDAKTEAAKERMRDLEVDVKVLDFLAHRISTDVRTLEGALNRLFAIASMSNRPATIEMAQRELQDLLRHSDRKVSVEEIQRKVAEHFNIRLADMHSPRRARSVARPRQVAMYLCKQLTQKSLPDIGRKFGGRDHTTVMHAVKKVTQLRATDSAFDDDVERLRRALEG